MHGIVKYFLPSIWRGSSYIRTAKRLLGPEIVRKYAARKSLDQDGKNDGEQATLLSWMMDTATGKEATPDHLAHLEIVISLASIHTSQMNAVHVLYDLAAHPQYLSALREEILEAANTPGGWNKTSYSKLRKLDSFLKESQRLNPPSVLSMHRVMQRDHILSDGTKLPKGAHVAMPVNAIQNDAEVLEGSSDFDPFRYSKLRENPQRSHLHQFATTDATHLNFGHGKYSCPGRFFAALEIKTILVLLIMNYDFKLVVEGKRPENLTAHEFIFPNPAGELLMKSRGANFCPF
jgi:cytochrome P450